MQAGPRYGQGLLTGLWDLPAFNISPDVANQMLAGKKVEDLQREIDRTYQPRSFVIPDLTVTMRKSFSARDIVHARNVLGLLRGSDPTLKDEVVTVTGHYDHGGTLGNRIYRGADDNASGTIGVLDTAEAYVHGNVRPKRGILFIVFDAEERGLLGSFYYVDHPVVPLEKTVANLNMDMIGRDEESATWHTTADQNRNGVNIVGTLYNPDLRQIIETVNRELKLKLDFKTDSDDPEAWFARSDHFGFAEKSIPMVLFNTGENPDYHTENDTWDRINYPKMEKIIRLVFLTSVQVANAGQRPKFTP
jgi:Zn-dependent M28 family amino/carboxypeptidase